MVSNSKGRRRRPGRLGYGFAVQSCAAWDRGKAPSHFARDGLRRVVAGDMRRARADQLWVTAFAREHALDAARPRLKITSVDRIDQPRPGKQVCGSVVAQDHCGTAGERLKPGRLAGGVDIAGERQHHRRATAIEIAQRCEAQIGDEGEILVPFPVAHGQCGKIVEPDDLVTVPRQREQQVAIAVIRPGTEQEVLPQRIIDREESRVDDLGEAPGLDTRHFAHLSRCLIVVDEHDIGRAQHEAGHAPPDPAMIGTPQQR